MTIKNRVLRVLISLILLIGMVSVLAPPVHAASFVDVTITATPTYVALTVSDGGTNTWAIGTVAGSTAYWWTNDGNAPAEPFVDGNMKLTVTNTGSVDENVKIHDHAFTGGTGWTISTDDTPAEGEISIRAGKTGTANEAAMVQVITTDTELIHQLTVSGHTHACLELETPSSFADGAPKSGVTTFTAEQHV